MSFWDNNKDTFKAVGKATAVGIGRGAKTVSKAGYQTYKNSEAKRKGLPPPNSGSTTTGGTNGDSTSSITTPSVSTPGISKDQLNTLPPPPRRTVTTQAYTPGQVSYAANAHATGPPGQLPGGDQPIPSQPGYQRPSHPPPQPSLPQYSPQPDYAPSPPQASYQPSPAPLPPSRPQLPVRNNVSPPVTDTRSYNYGIPADQPEAASSKPKAPLPDASKFAPPPIHKGRGALGGQSSGSKPNTTRHSTSSTTTGTLPQVDKNKPAPVAVPAIAPGTDVSQFAPPPRPYHGPSGSGSPPPLTEPSTAPPAIHNMAPPPPQPLPARPSLSSSPTPVSTTPTGKVPPPKPGRKPQVNMPNQPPPYRENERRIDTPDISDLSIGDEEKPPVKPKPKGLSRSSTSDAHLQALENAINARGSSIPNHGNDSGFSSSDKKIPPPVKSKPPVGPKQVIRDPSIETKPLVRPPAIEEPIKSSISLEQVSAKPVSSKPVPPKPGAKPVIAPKPAVDKPIIAPKPAVQKPVALSPQVTKQSSPDSSTPKSTTPVPPPPPSRNYARSSVTVTVHNNSQPSGPPQLDLELATGWFTSLSGPMTLPKALQGLNYTTSYSGSTQSVGGRQTTSHTRYLTVRIKDLSIIKYKITWTNDDLTSTKAIIDEYVPSPINHPPSINDLINASNQFGEHVAAWSEHNIGKTVGRGECWDLAKFALEKGCGKHAFVSNYTVHGFPILQIEGTDSGIVSINGKPQYDEIRRGDILQFDRCIFYNQAANRTSTVGAPDHTSVVVDKQPDKLMVAEQNVNGVKSVVIGEIIVRDLQKGKLVVYRPMPAAWAGDLAP